MVKKILNGMRILFGKLSRRTNDWLEGNPRLRDRLQDSGSLKGGSEAIARGIAIGLFIGLTPTVGFQTILMLTACILFAGNFPAAFATSFISNPFTMAPIYWGYHELGEAVFLVIPMLSDYNDGRILGGMFDGILFTGLGSLLIAIPVSIGSYLIMHFILINNSSHRNRRRQAHRSD
jgi:uncharacterized protein